LNDYFATHHKGFGNYYESMVLRFCDSLVLFPVQSQFVKMASLTAEFAIAL